MIKILKMIIKSIKKNTLRQSKSIIIKNNNFKRIYRSCIIILNLLFTTINIKISKILILNKLMNSKLKATNKITNQRYPKRNIFSEKRNNVYKINKGKSSKTLQILEI